MRLPPGRSSFVIASLAVVIAAILATTEVRAHAIGIPKQIQHPRSPSIGKRAIAGSHRRRRARKCRCRRSNAYITVANVTAFARECNAFSRLIVAELNIYSDFFNLGQFAAASEALRTARRDVERYGTADQRKWSRVAQAYEAFLDGPLGGGSPNLRRDDRSNRSGGCPLLPRSRLPRAARLARARARKPRSRRCGQRHRRRTCADVKGPAGSGAGPRHPRHGAARAG